MTKIKKLLLSLSVAVAIMIFVLGGGIVVNSLKNDSSNSDFSNNPTVNTSAKNSANQITLAKPDIYTFKESEIDIQQGFENIDFTYSPDVNSRASSGVAYEYTFSNPMEVDMAVGLKEMDATGVTVSYAYSDTRLPSITNTSSIFEVQRLAPNETKYIYIVVTASESTSYFSSITWYQGEAGELSIMSGNTPITSTIVKGLEIPEPQVTVAQYDYLEGWYLDEHFTISASFPLIKGDVTLYPHVIEQYYGNLPSDWIAYDSSADTYYVKRGSSALPTSLVIPAYYTMNGRTGKVTYIADHTDGVFYHQRSITSVKLPNTLKTIGVHAFRYCEGITNVVIPEGVTTIKTNAFRDCLNIESLQIPSTVTSIEGNIIWATYTLSRLVVHEDNPVYDSRNNCNGLIHTATNTLMGGSIGTTIPNTVTTIGNNAFFYVRTLKSITIPASVTSIGTEVFTACDSLATIKVDSANTKYDSRNNCNAIIETATNKLIYGTFTTVIPEGVVTIGAKAFQIVFTTPTFNITIPASVNKIEVNAFYNAKGLEEVTFEDISHWHYTSNSNYTSGTSIDVRSTTNSATYLISSYVSQYWYKLTPNLPSDWIAYNSTSATYYVTRGTSTLPTKLVIPGLYTRDGVTALVTYIADHSEGVFYKKTFTSVKLPQTLLTIGTRAFSYCEQLLSIEVPEGVTTIKSLAFYCCFNVQSAQIPSTVTSIDRNIFQCIRQMTSLVVHEDNPVYDSRNNCNGLIETATNTLMGGSIGTVIPNTVTTIGQAAFNYVRTLKSITIPASVTNIGTAVFNGCDSLRTIVVDSANTKFDSRNNCNAIIETATNKLIYGITTTVIPEGVVTIGANAFRIGYDVKFNINIPDSVTTIQANAFNGAKGLTNVTFANKHEMWSLTSGSTTYLKDVLTDATNGTWLRSTYVAYKWTTSSVSADVAFIGNVGYVYLDDALSAVQSGETIAVYPLTNGRTVSITKNATLPTNASLILYYGANSTDHTPNGVATYGGRILSDQDVGTCTLTVTMKTGVTLTVSEGATLEVAGQLICGRVQSPNMGYTGGKYAKLNMIGSATINVNGGAIKSTGFINSNYNNSHINVNSGTVYMPLVIRDFRGGTYVYATWKAGVTIFSQYQLLNITTNISLSYNARLIGYANLFLETNTSNPASPTNIQTQEVKFIGNTTDYLFQQTTESSLINLKITNGISKFDFSGGGALNYLVAKVDILISVTLSSEDFHLPLCWTLDITLNSGTYNFTKDIKMLPGSKLTVGADATANFADLVIYSENSYTDRNTSSDVLNYPEGKGDAIFTLNGTMTCWRAMGYIHGSTEGASLTIESAYTYNYILEPTGKIQGSTIFASIKTEKVTAPSNECKLIDGNNRYTDYSITSPNTYTYRGGFWNANHG